MCKKWGYVRVSSKDQNEKRQLDAMQAEGVNPDLIYTDKQSGKDFNRPQYKKLVEAMNEGDCLFIQSIDRLGRNYDEIQKEWKRITQDMKCDIAVLDMPILDTRTTNRTDGKTLDSRFVADLVLQILSYVAEKERQNIRSRQRQGIAVMDQKEDINGVVKAFSTKTGRPTGRPAATFPDNWNKVYKAWKDGKITATEAMKQTGTKRNTFYKLAKLSEE